MSDVRVESGLDQKVILLRPEVLKTNPRYNVRPFSTEFATEEESSILEFANVIEQCGQLDPVLITPEHEIVAGHRRRRAILIINEKRTIQHQPLLDVRCVITYSKKNLWRDAIVSNLHREDYSPMEVAFLITQIREEYGWKANNHRDTQRVADFLGVCKSLVQQYERFNGMQRDVQRMLHSKKISVASATQLLKLEPARHMEALKRAAVLQQEDDTEKAMIDFDTGKKSQEETLAAIQKPKQRVKHRYVIKAIRERRGKPITRSQKDFLEHLRRARTIHACPERLAEYLYYLTDVWGTGRGTDEELDRLFLALCESMMPALGGASAGKRSSLAC